METPFPPFEPEGKPGSARLRDIPLRVLFPNVLTLLAICSGMTAIRFAVEGRLNWAIGAIILAAFLDGIDGRVARFLKSTTRFGAQLDSLADFVNFGVAPAMILYFALLGEIKAFGWVAGLLYAVCACLRLARFNLQLDNKTVKPDWQSDFFVGVPAPAGAMTALLPVYFMLLGLEPSLGVAIVAALYLLGIGLLMVSNLPTYSGKNIGKRIPSNIALPLILGFVVIVAILLSYPWIVLSAIALAYLISLPLGRHYYLKLEKQNRAKRAPRKKPSGKTKK